MGAVVDDDDDVTVVSGCLTCFNHSRDFEKKKKKVGEKEKEKKKGCDKR